MILSAFFFIVKATLPRWTVHLGGNLEVNVHPTFFFSPAAFLFAPLSFPTFHTACFHSLFIYSHWSFFIARINSNILTYRGNCSRRWIKWNWPGIWSPLFISPADTITLPHAYSVSLLQFLAFKWISLQRRIRNEGLFAWHCTLPLWRRMIKCCWYFLGA